MKKLALILFAAIIILNLTSCSSEESMNLDEPQAKSLLESYTLTRDARGSYSLVSKVADGVSTELFQNEETNTNEIHMFEGTNNTARQANNTLSLIDNKLNIEFFNGNNRATPLMTIIDGDVSLNQRSGDDENYFLNSYTVISNEDGTYQFNFEVKDSVNVSYGYNASEGINEIYLTDDGVSAAASYTKSYTLDANGELKVDFVHTSTSSRSSASTLRPRIIVGV